jgi:hypothetical protein
VLEGWLAQWRESVASGSACPSSSPGDRLSAGSALAVSQFGSLRRSGSARSVAYGLTADRRIQKARSGVSGAGFILDDDEDMPVICPTCQNVFAGSLKRPDPVTLHGVVFDFFVERPIHGSEPCWVGAMAVRPTAHRIATPYKDGWMTLRPLDPN